MFCDIRSRATCSDDSLVNSCLGDSAMAKRFTGSPKPPALGLVRPAGRGSALPRSLCS